MRWLDTNTVPPRSAKPLRWLRSQRMPSGSRPLDGSSSSRTCGSPSSAPARARRWRMPRENPPARWSAADSRPTSARTSSTRPAGMPLMAAMARRWLRAVRPGCMHRASSTAPTSRAGCAEVGVADAVVADLAGIGSGEPDHHPHRGRLAGAVRADEAGDPAGGDVEGQVVDGGAVAVVLGESGDGDHEVLLVLKVGMTGVMEINSALIDAR